MAKTNPVAVFWDLGYVDPVDKPEAVVERIRHIGNRHGEVKFIHAYIGRMLQGQEEVEMVDALKTCDVGVYRCPKLRGRKPTIHHTMEMDIMSHVSLEHPETRTVVFITGERDFTYCSQVLRQKGVRVVVLIENSFGRIVETDSNAYWPRPVKSSGKKKKKKKEKGE